MFDYQVGVRRVASQRREIYLPKVQLEPFALLIGIDNDTNQNSITVEIASFCHDLLNGSMLPHTELETTHSAVLHIRNPRIYKDLFQLHAVIQSREHREDQIMFFFAQGST